MQKITYVTPQLTIERTAEHIPYPDAIEPLLERLNTQRGILLASSFEYPGRYTRWDIGFLNPPLVIYAQQHNFTIEALNQRGEVLLSLIKTSIVAFTHCEIKENAAAKLSGVILPAQEKFSEELRSKQPSIFSILRIILNLFYTEQDAYLGLYGAFGYDLAFQFEPVRLKILRDAAQRDMVLYLPDEIYVVDHHKETACIYRYEFFGKTHSTNNLPRSGGSHAFTPAMRLDKTSDYQPGEYAALVEVAKQAFKRGDLFEVVPGQSFFERCQIAPAELFRRLRVRNPAPYSFLMNLGQDEYLVGASPEMYVRVQGKRVETCPISGTIARGHDAIADAGQILQLLASSKETAELTMCTDVDRNDKSRICEPGSVKVLGRRQIEMYSRVIHTVDHVEGYLREGYDALDAFLTHTWAVTVTGAPKQWAMQFIEDHERSPRRWYGGAVGIINFNGNLNTGLTLRTIQIRQGIAEIRAGATLLYDSVPADEEQETQLKASVLLDIVRGAATPESDKRSSVSNTSGKDKRILLVDHQDSFVHTLANYFRQTGAQVLTLRNGFSAGELAELKPHLIVLSPGPGCPKDFALSHTIKMALDAHVPLFGVCLGLQGIVEFFGGKLAVLDCPMHGKPSLIKTTGGHLFKNMPPSFNVGRYHSLYADKNTFPDELLVSAESADNIIMAIEHKTLPIWAVQFHPESILSLDDSVGMKIIENVVSMV